MKTWRAGNLCPHRPFRCPTQPCQSSCKRCQPLSRSASQYSLQVASSSPVKAAIETRRLLSHAETELDHSHSTAASVPISKGCRDAPMIAIVSEKLKNVPICNFWPHVFHRPLV